MTTCTRFGGASAAPRGLFDALQERQQIERFLERHTGADDLGVRFDGTQLAAGLRLSKLLVEKRYDVVVFNTAKGPITIDLSRKSFSGGGGGGRIEGVEGIIGSLFGDTMLGDDGPNLFDGGFGADIFFGGAGDDTLVGGDGLDLAIYLGSSSKYTVTADGKGGLTISGGADGRDTLTGVERISFGDKSLAFDLSPEGSAGGRHTRRRASPGRARRPPRPR